MFLRFLKKWRHLLIVTVTLTLVVGSVWMINQEPGAATNPASLATGAAASMMRPSDNAGGVPALEKRVTALQAEVDELQTTVDELETLVQDVDELQALLAGVSRNGDTLTFSGMNLEVLNGLGHTYTRNGLGNVIIGYNEDNGNDEVRTGSHYLVVGRDHTYTSYGGIVVGYDNSATGGYSSVSGGLHNTASGPHSSVSGGDGNIASGWSASVSGGRENTANGTASSVSGGYAATASGYRSSILGGHAPSVTWSYGIYPD